MSRSHDLGRRPVRLTRRGRAVLSGLIVLLAGLLVAGTVVLVIGVLAPPASRAADPAAPGAGGGSGSGPAVAVVRPGDTLWSVTARHVPSYDAYGMIEEIRRLNHLPDYTVHPGQELILPERP